MSAKFTAGPWAIGFRAYAVTALDGQMKICDIRGWGHLTGKGVGALGLSHEDGLAIQTANANLIAAAPDLYEALEEFSREYDGFEDGRGFPCPTLAKARAALTKAIGPEKED